MQKWIKTDLPIVFQSQLRPHRILFIDSDSTAKIWKCGAGPAGEWHLCGCLFVLRTFKYTYDVCCVICLLCCIVIVGLYYLI